jgi:predicted nucleic acid-binding protein
MYLIDSSVWIDYFRPQRSSNIKRRVRQILQEDQALICGVILVEVLRGARNEKEYSLLLDSLGSLQKIPFEQEVFERAAQWGFQLDRKGKIASTTDLLIAAAAYRKAHVLHNDAEYEMIASEVPLRQERISS